MKFPEISRRFGYILNLRKMTAQELSDKSGVGKSSISHYVNGSNEPHNKNAAKLASVLNVNPQWLMGFDVPMDENAPFGIFVPMKKMETLEGVDVSNENFVADMDLLSRDMTLRQMDNILEYARLIKLQAMLEERFPNIKKEDRPLADQNQGPGGSSANADHTMKPGQDNNNTSNE